MVKVFSDPGLVVDDLGSALVKLCWMPPKIRDQPKDHQNIQYGERQQYDYQERQSKPVEKLHNDICG